MFIEDIGLQFSVLLESLSGFDIMGVLASQNEFGSTPSSSVSWNNLTNISVNSLYIL